MNGVSGYIKIDRKILNWEWYKNLNTCRLFFHLLLKANWRDKKFEGKVIQKGSFVSSFQKLSQETGLTIREIRTAINHLKSTGELTVKTYSKYSLFTVNNYCQYQIIDTKNDIQTTDEGREDEFEKEGSDSITTIISDDTARHKDVQRAVDAWNSLEACGIKKVSRMRAGTKRYNSLNARITEYGINGVLEAIDRVRCSSYLHGKNKNGWVITFDWFVLQNNFPKVHDGNYDDHACGESAGKINGPNKFHNFEQRDTDYDAIVIEELKGWIDDG